jgi:hypothetical protein
MRAFPKHLAKGSRLLIVVYIPDILFHDIPEDIIGIISTEMDISIVVDID